MKKLKWFAGGAERGEVAEEHLAAIIRDLNKPEEKEFKDLLVSYYLEFKNQSQGVPYIIDRLNIEVSRYLLKTHLKLSAENSDRLQKISELNYIRML